MINIEYFGNVNEIAKQFISRSGELHLPVLGPISVAGLTFSEARELIEELSVDMAAERTPANNIPRTPIGK